MIFLDNHSTTKVDQAVVDAMLPYFTGLYSNPSSHHSFGIETREVVESVRSKIAKRINAEANQIFFTSGATESNNTALLGFAQHHLATHNTLTITTSNIEHASIMMCAQELSKTNRWNKLCVNNDGTINILDIDANTDICSVHAANNEIGTVYNLYDIGQYCKKLGIYFHTDATQAFGKIHIDVQEQNIDALSLSAHKIYGPKGIGVLYLKDYTKIQPLLLGGMQEKIRSGTLNVPGIVGLGAAVEVIFGVDWAKVKELRDYLYYLLSSSLRIELHGTMQNRLPNNLNISIPGIKSEIIIKGMTDVIVSSGSACKSGTDTVSEVLTNICAKYADCAIRFGLGKDTTKEEIEYAANKIIHIVSKLNPQALKA